LDEPVVLRGALGRIPNPARAAMAAKVRWMDMGPFRSIFDREDTDLAWLENDIRDAFSG